MTSTRANRRPAWRHLAAGLVVAASAGTAPAGAVPAKAPSLRVVSTVAGTRAMAPFAMGAWTQEDAVWTVPLRTWSVPAGTTTVTATWRSPAVRVSRKGVVFAAAVDTDQQAVLGNHAVEHWVRVCRAGRCGRWEGIGSDRVPNHVDATSLPYRITTGLDLEIAWLGPPVTLWFEWRYAHEQRDLTVAEATIRMAAGPAAARVQ